MLDLYGPEAPIDPPEPEEEDDDPGAAIDYYYELVRDREADRRSDFDGIRYYDPRGREVFVAETPDGRFAPYCGPRADPRRLMHRYLPARATRAQAETDLDLHAAMERWRRVRA